LNSCHVSQSWMPACVENSRQLICVTHTCFLVVA
jgi:hypothetical protein